jgi:hypothetical protein
MGSAIASGARDWRNLLRLQIHARSRSAKHGSKLSGSAVGWSHHDFIATQMH